MTKPKAVFSGALNLLEHEQRLWKQGFTRVMGLDEVGRGCLSGPVVAAGVILNPEQPIEGLNDSKKLTENARNELEPIIKERALFWSVQEASVEEIDRINILKASMLAMHRSIEQATPPPDFLLIDGNYFSPLLIPHETLVKGDGRSASIAAASILAKVYRDRLMRKLAAEYPGYGWETNVGYGTKTHLKGLEKLGQNMWHRKSFKVGEK